MTETEALVILNAVTGVGNVTIRGLVEYFGSAKKVFQVSFKELSASGIVSPVLSQKIFDFPRDTFLRNEYNLVARNRVSIISWREAGYPALLGEIADAPVLLYVKGKLPPANVPAMAVVGSRRASVYGITTARKFSSRLAELGIAVISGLARGVDTAAHEGALQVNGITIAVLGCGLAEIYPPENDRLAQRITKDGAVISEFPMTMAPLAFNFPRRNRIISGMALGTLVAEAASRSGALITCECALDQGREVFAVPGQVDNPNSRGVNKLIQTGAKLVNRPEDILEELALVLRAFAPAAPEQKPQPGQEVLARGRADEFEADEQAIIRQISDSPVHIDDLIARCGIGRERMFAVLTELELKKVIRQLPGKYFARTEK